MAAVRDRDTGPEVALRRAVWSRGSRFRLHARHLPGRPDLSNKGAKVAVFVDGCFWHGCPKHFTLPKTRRDFWKAKIQRNMERRNEVLGQYPDDWTIIQVLECNLKTDLDGWADRVATALRGPT